ncbi:hypothetical protein CsNV_051 [Callinectes sapidus nudivirus]|nr:hypothetical protein CsNV_051 [Callinectes sapidus nudivirus]
MKSAFFILLIVCASTAAEFSPSLNDEAQSNCDILKTEVVKKRHAPKMTALNATMYLTSKNWNIVWGINSSLPDGNRYHEIQLKQQKNILKIYIYFRRTREFNVYEKNHTIPLNTAFPVIFKINNFRFLEMSIDGQVVTFNKKFPRIQIDNKYLRSAYFVNSCYCPYYDTRDSHEIVSNLRPPIYIKPKTNNTVVAYQRNCKTNALAPFVNTLYQIPPYAYFPFTNLWYTIEDWIHFIIIMPKQMTPNTRYVRFHLKYIKFPIFEDDCRFKSHSIFVYGPSSIHYCKFQKFNMTNTNNDTYIDDTADDANTDVNTDDVTTNVTDVATSSVNATDTTTTTTTTTVDTTTTTTTTTTTVAATAAANEPDPLDLFFEVTNEADLDA